MAIDRASDWVPESCSVPSVEQPLRVAVFDRLFTESVLQSSRITSTRLDLVVAQERLAHHPPPWCASSLMFKRTASGVSPSHQPHTMDTGTAVSLSATHRVRTVLM